MTQRRQWSDLSPRSRAGIIVGALVQYALLGAALVSLRSRSADEIRGPKALWRGLVFVNFVGPIAYFVWGRK